VAEAGTETAGARADRPADDDPFGSARTDDHDADDTGACDPDDHPAAGGHLKSESPGADDGTRPRDPNLGKARPALTLTSEKGWRVPLTCSFVKPSVRGVTPC
jgi:hypothetical protein